MSLWNKYNASPDASIRKKFKQTLKKFSVINHWLSENLQLEFTVYIHFIYIVKSF